MHHNQLQEIAIITSDNGVWQREMLSLGQEKSYSPFQWKRMFKEKMSPDYQSAMEELRRVDNRIARLSDELNYLLKLLPSDPTSLADISLILIEIKQRLDSIQEAGRQIKPPKYQRMKDFYGRFHVKIPANLRTASEQPENKIATAGFIGDFVHWIGKKINEYTDPEIREMKRVVTHLLNTTKETVSSINRTLNDMRSARTSGDIRGYVNGVKMISQTQSDFKKEFSAVFDSYLKEPYEHALALEEQAKAEAEAQGLEYQPTHEEVSVDAQGNLEVTETDLPSAEEEAPLEVAEDAEELKPPSMVSDTARQRMLGEESGPSTDMEAAPDTIPRTIPGEPYIEVEPETTPELDYWQAKERYEKEFGKTQYAPHSPYSEAPSTPKTRTVEESPTRKMDTDLKNLRRQMPPPIPVPEYKAPPETVPQSTAIKTPILKSPFAEGVGGEAPPSSEELTEIPTKQKPNWKSQTLQSLYSSICVNDAIQKASHEKFLDKLSKISETENKYIIAAFMAKYSEELEDINPHVSAKLLKAALDFINE